MRKLCIFIFFVLLKISAFALQFDGNQAQDTAEVIKLNKLGLDSRFTSPEQTISYAEKAMAIAKRIGYKAGIGESYRVMGIGKFYSNQSQKAIDDYLTALDYFKQVNDLRSEAKIYNNIGILYRDNDYDDALDFFNQGLVIATKLKDDHLVASIYLNMGDVYFRKKSFYQALIYDSRSNKLFTASNDSVNLVLCLQNTGVVYFNLHQYDKADSLLLMANKRAKQLGLNETIASVDLTIAESYIVQSKFAEAEKVIQEGEVLSAAIKDEKLQADYKYTSYQLEAKRKNYELALSYLQGIYHEDSVTFKQNSSTEINLIREQVKQTARIKENEIQLQRQQYDRVRFWAVTIVAVLLLFLVALLISNVKRKTKTNLQLTALNAEVSRQKDNLDRINHHLEEIIDERTKDLQVKNKKLSEYSSYLSHQIRGPIATLKGLLNLEKEALVDQRECIRMMNKSVGEIDDKIIEMSDMLHDPGRAGF
jgi:tetratricopeptide (TPR) repeat protein